MPANGKIAQLSQLDICETHNYEPVPVEKWGRKAKGIKLDVAKWRQFTAKLKNQDFY